MAKRVLTSGEWLRASEALARATLRGIHREDADRILGEAIEDGKIRTREVNRKWVSRWHGPSESRIEEFLATDVDELIDKVVGEMPNNESKGSSPSTTKRTRVAAQFEAVRKAISDLWPEGIPKTLTGKHRNRMILDRCGPVSESTIKNVLRTISDK